VPQVESRHDLSPLQVVRLFQSLQPTPDSPDRLGQWPTGMHFGESIWTVDEAPDPGTLARAWQLVVNCHPVLRSCFTWEDLEHPAQLIYSSGDSVPRWFDWRGLGSTAQRLALTELLSEQSYLRPRLDRAPLARLFAIWTQPGQFRLVLMAHPLLLDDWSVAAVVDDLLVCYVTLRVGSTAVRPRPRIEHHLAELATLDILDTEAFWRTELRGFCERTRIEKEPAEASHSGQPDQSVPTLTVPFRLEAEPSRQLLALTAGAGVELETGVVAAWTLLISRYARALDVVVGYDIPGRAYGGPELTDALGAFRNAVPLRVHVDERRPILHWLADLQRRREAVQRHEYVPEALIREWSEVPRSDVLFSHQFAFREAVAPPSAAAIGLPVRREFIPDVQVEALRLRIDDTGSGLDGSVVYRTGLFEPERVPAMVRHLARILASFADHPTGRLADVDMLTEPERTQLLREWNATNRPYPADLCIHEMFKRQVADNPDQVAVVHADRTVRYRELDEAAGRWVDRLRRIGVGPDRLVGVHVRRCPEMVALLLGVLRAGGAYVPLDPAYPFDRLAFMARDAGLTALVTDRTTVGDSWPELPCPLLSLDGSALDAGQAPSPAGGQPGSHPDHLAYVLYTSGSTGRPNGVAITHRNAVDLLHWVHEVFADDLDCVLATTSICFDCSILEIFGPLCWGGTTVLADSALDLRSLPVTWQVRLMHTVPSVMAELLRRGGPPSALRTVILGGESPWPALIEELRERGHVERIFNLYGPAEVTSYATAALIDKSGLTTPPSIGRPVANTEIYLLDPYGNPVPAGVPGELYVAGAGLARGYLHQPVRTAERFVPNRFGDRPGTRMYRTGDLACYRPDGTMAFLGRVDDQLKVRGFRIEPGEIEQALLRHPSVTDTVVVAQYEGEAAVGLTAYAAVIEPPPQPSELRDHLRAMLPSYLIPDAFVLGELPRLPNGKVDRQALHLGPRAGEGVRHRRYVAPGRPAEHALARIWAGLLGLDRVGVRDNFFELGGDSFLAIRMISAAGDAGLRFTATDVLEFQTVAELAAVAESSQAPNRAES
jgi:amino acid adenylation domain-containing protein